MDNSLTTFIFFCFLLTITPGVDTALVLRSSISGGKKSLIVTVLGICSGLLIHALMSSLGLSAVLHQSSKVYNLVKMLGACYLIYLGLNTLYETWKNGDKLNLKFETGNVNSSISLKSEFRKGFITNVLNPKVAIFYVTFLPQFINVNESALLQSLSLSFIHILISMAWLFMFGHFVYFFKAKFENTSTRKVIESITGSAFIFFGVTLGAGKD